MRLFFFSSSRPITSLKYIFMKQSTFTRCFKSSLFQIKREPFLSINLNVIHLQRWFQKQFGEALLLNRYLSLIRAYHRQHHRHWADHWHRSYWSLLRDLVCEQRSPSLQWITEVVWCWDSGTSHLRLLSLSAPGLPRGTLPHPTQHPGY